MENRFGSLARRINRIIRLENRKYLILLILMALQGRVLVFDRTTSTKSTLLSNTSVGKFLPVLTVLVYNYIAWNFVDRSP